MHILSWKFVPRSCYGENYIFLILFSLDHLLIQTSFKHEGHSIHHQDPVLYQAQQLQQVSLAQA